MSSKVFSTATLLLATACLASCATSEVSRTKEMLSTAGFREIRPETAKQKELYAAAPSYKMHQIKAQGKTFYAYKDEEHGTAFIGDEIKFRQYQRLLMQESAAQPPPQPTLMPSPYAMGWYGAYGPFLHGPRYGTLRYLR
jgi:hypothetical protein